MTEADLSRRTVLGGGTLVVAFCMTPAAFAQPGPAAPGLPGSLRTSPLLDSWIRVDSDGRLTVFTGKAELGQGLKTALVQVAAEELDVPPSAIRLVTADTARTPNEGFTAGSHSMQDSGTAILNAAANVRVLLAEAAAARWSVRPETIATTGDGRLKARDGRTLSYGELAAALSLHVEARPDAPLRPRPRFRVIGQDLPRVDIPAKLTGGPAYVQDLRLPGMLHARVLRGPSEQTRLKAPDLQAIAAMPGVARVVQNGAFAAVIAEREWTAIRALQRALAGGWEHVGPPIPAADPLAAVQRGAGQDLVILDVRGPAGAPAHTVRVRYTRPWLMHGSIGPSCAVALFKDGALTVWTHSQGVYPLRGALAQLLKLPPERIRCIQVEGSGCYGHNGADDVAADAALAAMAVPGRPVRLQWMREQEHGFEPLGSGMAVQAQASIDAGGRIVDWRYEVWSNPHNGRPGSAGALLAGREVEPPFPPDAPRPIPMPEGGGDRNAVPIYAIPNGHVVFHFVTGTAPLRVSALRSLGAHMNVFAVESLMDELARAGGADPVAFRLAHLQDPRAREVVGACAERFGWARRARGDSRRGSGFAFARYKNLASYCAVAMEVEVERETGAVAVRRVVAAVDSGEAVNPDGIRNQIEGAIMQSLSWTGLEAVGFDADRRTSFDWSAYPIARFGQVPGGVQVQVIDRPGEPFLGAGEAGQGPAAAALANAVADATGVRMRDLPLSPERLKAAIGI
jgi:CO/xanthine dehydrogenase Mo-binding subunit